MAIAAAAHAGVRGGGLPAAGSPHPSPLRRVNALLPDAPSPLPPLLQQMFSPTAPGVGAGLGTGLGAGAALPHGLQAPLPVRAFSFFYRVFRVLKHLKPQNPSSGGASGGRGQG